MLKDHVARGDNLGLDIRVATIFGQKCDYLLGFSQPKSYRKFH